MTLDDPSNAHGHAIWMREYPEQSKIHFSASLSSDRDDVSRFGLKADGFLTGSFEETDFRADSASKAERGDGRSRPSTREA